MTSTPRDSFVALDMSAGPPELDPTLATAGTETVAPSEARAPTEDPARQVDPALARQRRVTPDPAPLDRHGPARIIALCNQKGGVGKTTTAINLGAALGEYGRRVLLVDFDPQGALSVGLGIQSQQLERTIYNLLMERGVTLEDVLLKTSVPGVDLLPSNIDLSAAEVQLVNEVAREQTLARALAPVLDDYDFVLIDCQPSLGLLTVNALTAAHGVIIPLECEFFSLRGVALLIDTIDKVQERLNPKLRIDGILRHDVRRSDVAWSPGLFPRGRGVRRRGIRQRHLPHRALSGDNSGRRAHHELGTDLGGRPGLPTPGARGARARRVRVTGRASPIRGSRGYARRLRGLPGRVRGGISE